MQALSRARLTEITHIMAQLHIAVCKNQQLAGLLGIGSSLAYEAHLQRRRAHSGGEEQEQSCSTKEDDIEKAIIG